MCAKLENQCLFCIFICKRSHFPLKYMHMSQIIIYVFRIVSKIIPSWTFVVFCILCIVFGGILYYWLICHTCLKGVYVIIVFYPTFKGWRLYVCRLFVHLFVSPFVFLSTHTNLINMITQECMKGIHLNWLEVLTMLWQSTD